MAVSRFRRQYININKSIIQCVMVLFPWHTLACLRRAVNHIRSRALSGYPVNEIPPLATWASHRCHSSQNSSCCCDLTLVRRHSEPRVSPCIASIIVANSAHFHRLWSHSGPWWLTYQYIIHVDSDSARAFSSCEIYSDMITCIVCSQEKQSCPRHTREWPA